MIPVFFPSPWIPESLRGLLLACFDQVTVFQPARELVPDALRRLEKNGRLDIRLPDEKSDEEAGEDAIQDLPNLLSAYHAWVDLHQGERPAFHKFARLYTPGSDDTSTAWIRSKIRNPEGKKTGTQCTPDEKVTDPLLTARLFLAIVQEYDRQDESLSRDLNSIDGMEQHLLHDLAPDEPPGSIAPRSPLPAEIRPKRPMPVQRLAAWRRLYAHCRQREHLPTASLSPFFITSDREVLQLVLDPVDIPEEVCRVVGIPPGGEDKPFAGTAVHQRIQDTLRTAVHGVPLSSVSTISFCENATCPENTGTLTIYRIKGNPASVELFGPGNGPKSSQTITADNESPFTLLGYIDCTLDSPKQLV